MAGLAIIYRPPLIGLLGYLTVLMYLPLAHTMLMLMRIPGIVSMEYALMSFGMGLAGVVLMWIGFTKEETAATWLGFVAGILIWVGWFEFTFEFFAHVLEIESMTNADGSLAIPAGLLFLQATILMFLALVIFMAANPDTRCRFFTWLHRNLRIRPAQMTPGYQRLFSRITAMELIFVTWFCYLVNLALYDTRVLGIDHPGTYVVFFTFLIWSIYLLYKLSRIRKLAPALRYAIPTTNISWLCVEVGGRWGLFSEIWLRPWDYAIEMSLVLAAFIIAAVLISKTPETRETAGAG